MIPRRCRPGDIYRAGPHKVICGDARDKAIVAALMDGELASMVITDPPYNVKIQGNVGGLGKIKHPEFAMASGEMSQAEFIAFLKASFANLVAFSKDGSIHFICMDWRHIGEVNEAASGVYSELKNLNVWSKTMVAWGLFTGPGTSWSLSTRAAPSPTSTISNWGSMGAIGPMSGNMRASTHSRPDALRSWPCTRP
jgi:hypothetical protein